MIKKLLLFPFVINLGCALSVVSCSTRQENEWNLEGDKSIDIYSLLKKEFPQLNDDDFYYLLSNKANELLMPYFQSWYDNLSVSNFATNSNNKIKNLYCDSERQALAVYSTCWGHFWNNPLHNSKKPLDYTMETDLLSYPLSTWENPNNVAIRGNDYIYIYNALKKSISPVSLKVFHGVEFMENEFWDQLKFFIKNSNGKYDYSDCVNKIVTTNGFLSTTLNRDWALGFSDGRNWLENNDLQPPLKEPFMFEINLRKGTSNVAYISGYDLINQKDIIYMQNTEAQFLFNIGTQFKIANYYKEGDVNIFAMEVI